MNKDKQKPQDAGKKVKPSEIELHEEELKQASGGYKITEAAARRLPETKK